MSSKNKLIPVRLKCKPYIAKFAHSLYGSPIVANHNSTLGCFVNLALTKEIYENRQPAYEPKQDIRTGQIELLINMWQFERLGFEITDDKAIVITRYLEECFQESLYLFCKNNVNDNVRYKGYADCVYQFAQLHKLDLDNDISFEGLKKMEYRFRSRLQEKNTVMQPTLF